MAGTITGAAVAQELSTGKRASLGNLDLNLMRALDALLTEANVTRAAARLNLTQSTLSAALARLRRHFDDELLHRDGNQLELTPLALRLRPLVGDALDSAERLFHAHVSFEPAESTRRFTVVASDYEVNVVGAAWSGAVSRSAPHARMAFRSLSFESFSPPEVRARDVDGLLAPHAFISDALPHVDILQDRWVVIADAANQLIGDEPTLGELAALPWATAFEGPHQVPAGLDPRDWTAMSANVQAVVGSFADLPLCVRGTPRIALVQERLTRALGSAPGLRVLDPPFTVEPITLAFWWHPAYNTDPEHIWLRSQLPISIGSAVIETSDSAY
jgi:DNA-binding transcriptional LysR family regulator